jgi:exo-beta-1,3-glucanase (GH17 family)
MKKLPYGKAICYSGYREGQSPLAKVYPTYEEIKEDLLILEKDYDYIRMYDPSIHAQTTLKVIRDHKISLKVMLGIDLLGEISNPECEWGGILTDHEIKANISYNEFSLRKLIELAHEYEDIIVAVSAGNEAVPEWNENLVSPKRVLYFVNELKKHTNQLVTYCENFYYWIPKLKEVAEACDLISIHTYPAWLNKDISIALSVSQNDYQEISNFYKDKQVIITEAGWPTASSRGIDSKLATLENQKKYLEEMRKWSEDQKIIIFFFEAFDEPWKGSNDQNEPEKHWGLYDVNRKVK